MFKILKLLPCIHTEKNCALLTVTPFLNRSKFKYFKICMHVLDKQKLRAFLFFNGHSTSFFEGFKLMRLNFLLCRANRFCWRFSLFLCACTCKKANSLCSKSSKAKNMHKIFSIAIKSLVRVVVVAQLSEIAHWKERLI